jgi:nucleoside transporter
MGIVSNNLSAVKWPPADSKLPNMNSSPRVKLFAMMVLEFFIWGAWLPLIFPYMTQIGFSAVQQSWVGSAFAIASIFGVFFSNQFADRNFSAEKFMAVSHLIGGIAILGLYFTRSFPVFLTLMLIHSLVYVPTISVANSLAFANLKDPTNEFGIIRMGGTIGWILASWPLFFILKGTTGESLIKAQSSIFLVAGVASLGLAWFSLSLPHTPPRPAVVGEDRFAWLKSGKRLMAPFILVLFIVTFIDATIHNGYFVVAGNFLGDIGIAPERIMPIMSLGQVAEILTMAVLGFFLKKLGWKVTMIIGILGHALRFGVFAFMSHNVPVIILVQLLHGICYAFFFATVYIFIDAAFPKDVRTSAQGWFNLLILGLGHLAAMWLFPLLKARMTAPDGTVDYQGMFLVPTGMALGAAILLAVFFHPPKNLDAPEEPVAPAH